MILSPLDDSLILQSSWQKVFLDHFGNSEF